MHIAHYEMDKARLKMTPLLVRTDIETLLDPKLKFHVNSLFGTYIHFDTCHTEATTFSWQIKVLLGSSLSTQKQNYTFKGERKVNKQLPEKLSGMGISNPT